MRKLSDYIALVVVLSFTAPVYAQVWLADRSDMEGPGFKLGDSLVLHPGLCLEGGYDTNALYTDSAAEGTGRLRITPYLDLATLSQQRRVQDSGIRAPRLIDFKLGVAGFYDWYINVANQSDFGVSASTSLVVFPEGMLSILVDASFARTLQPYEGAQGIHSRDIVRPGVGLRFRPGAGTLSFQVNYHVELTYFEDSDLSARDDRMVHVIDYENRWKVFPKTALVSRVQFAPVIYTGSQDRNKDSLPVRSWFGLQGLLTDRFGLTLMGGYGASFYQRGPNYDSFLAQGELMFFVTPFSQIRIGGDRDFVDSFFANYFVKTGGYVAYQQMFAGIVMATLKGDVYYRQYAKAPTFDDNGTQADPMDDSWTNVAERDDVWATGTLLVEIRATSWLAFHVSGQYTADVTNFEYTDAIGQTTNAGFQKFEVFGGVRGHY
jgi:hypothetical protein